MNYMKTSYTGTVEILATDVYQAHPITVQAPVGGSNVVKAGTPLKEDGTVTTGADAYGILLYDVDVDENPNGAVVVSGLVNSVSAQAHSGITYDVEALKASIPGIKFRPNIKSEEQGGGSGVAVVGTAIVGQDVTG